MHSGQRRLHTDAGSTDSDSGRVNTRRIRTSEHNRMSAELTIRASVTALASPKNNRIFALTDIALYIIGVRPQPHSRKYSRDFVAAVHNSDIEPKALSVDNQRRTSKTPIIFKKYWFQLQRFGLSIVIVVYLKTN